MVDPTRLTPPSLDISFDLAPPTVDVVCQTLRYGEHPEQVADLWLPPGAGPHPVVVSIHGGYFQQQYRRDLHDPMARALVATGLAVLNIEYRRARAGGAFETTTGDVMAAISLVQQRSELSPRVGVVGHSAGGYLALWAASHPDVDVVVALAPTADLVDCVRGGYDGGSVAAWLGGTPASDPDIYQQADLTRRFPTRAASHLMHAVDDLTVPLHQSERYVELARAAGDDSRLHRLDRGGHFEVIEPGTDAFTDWHAIMTGWANQ